MNESNHAQRNAPHTRRHTSPAPRKHHRWALERRHSLTGQRTPLNTNQSHSTLTVLQKHPLFPSFSSPQPVELGRTRASPLRRPTRPIAPSAPARHRAAVQPSSSRPITAISLSQSVHRSARFATPRRSSRPVRTLALPPLASVRLLIGPHTSGHVARPWPPGGPAASSYRSAVDAEPLPPAKAKLARPLALR